MVAPEPLDARTSRRVRGWRRPSFSQTSDFLEPPIGPQLNADGREVGLKTLQAVVHGAPEDWDARRVLGEADCSMPANVMGGLREPLKRQMLGYETRPISSTRPSSLADEIGGASTRLP